MPSVKDFKKSKSTTSQRHQVHFSDQSKAVHPKRRPGREAAEESRHGREEQNELSHATKGNKKVATEFDKVKNTSKQNKQELNMSENQNNKIKHAHDVDAGAGAGAGAEEKHSGKDTSDSSLKTSSPGPEMNSDYEGDEFNPNDDISSSSQTELRSETEIEIEPETEPKKVEISFFGSEILRAKMPKPFEVAEKVATDWVNNGNFEDINIGNPVADALARQGLQKAKEIEKKVIESGVIDKVVMQAFTYGLKAQEEINNIREQVKSKLGKK